MRKRPTSLLNTLFKSLLLPGIIAAFLGVFIVYSIVKEEYDELQDIALASKAHLMLQLLEAQNEIADISVMHDGLNPLSFELDLIDGDELTVFWVLDAAEDVILRSPDADRALLSARVKGAIVTANGYRIADATNPDASLTVVTATPMAERDEALSEVLISVTIGFILLGIFVAIAAYLAVRRSAAVIADLSTEIKTKDAYDLSPIDRKNTFAEIEPAIDTVDMLMARLDATLTAERAFATNAAHELRTPVAICLAHVQRLKTKLTNPDTSQSAVEIEEGLKRLTRLIERLLQMSRAQSGLGIAAVKADITPVIKLLLRELRERVPSPDQLVVKEPQGIWISDVDPDAIGIILNNLFDNALKHASGDAPMTVDASTRGRIVISNDCAPLAAADLENIKQRFSRNATRSEGFGLGLSIVQELCQQSGSTLELSSPQKGKTRGFSAALTLVVSDPR
ncbi:sensor histidine kinase [Sulfitobacter sp.]|jgi:two-component system OmpR family sensor kinase|uniref:sensor histidine kinase n=1 Tax=Sulfitobacter sp. TaxID=1903071 RepID=UPI0039E4ABEF